MWQKVAHTHIYTHNCIEGECKTILVKLKSIRIKSHKYKGKRCRRKNYILNTHTHTSACTINCNHTHTHTPTRSYLSERTTWKFHSSVCCMHRYVKCVSDFQMQTHTHTYTQLHTNTCLDTKMLENRWPNLQAGAQWKHWPPLPTPASAA